MKFFTEQILPFSMDSSATGSGQSLPSNLVFKWLICGGQQERGKNRLGAALVKEDLRANLGVGSLPKSAPVKLV